MEAYTHYTISIIFIQNLGKRAKPFKLFKLYCDILGQHLTSFFLNSIPWFKTVQKLDFIIFYL